MKYNFDKIYDRKNTGSIKWDNVESKFYANGILPMWIADMDFLAPNAVAEAISRRNEHGIYGYTESMPSSLRDAIANWLQKRHGWSVKHDWLCFTPGVVSALSISVLAYTEPGDQILIQPPVYPPFYKVIQNNGRIPVLNPLKLQDGQYTMDFEDMECKMRAGVKMMILCSPHNPVGRVWSREELARLSKLCVENDVLLVSDEIHSDIIYKNHRHIPAASISYGIEQKTITCVAASKTFGVAGLTTSASIIPNSKLRQKFINKLEGMGIEFGNIFGITASEAAYRHGEEWLEQLLEYLEGNLKILKEYFEAEIPGIRIINPEGTYLVWMDCRKLGMNSKELSEFMSRKAKVGLNDGAAFGAEGEGFQRINIACPRSILLESLKRISKAVKEVPTIAC